MILDDSDTDDPLGSAAASPAGGSLSAIGGNITGFPAPPAPGVSEAATSAANNPVSNLADQVVEGPQARALGVTGAGVKIGIISDSFNQLGGAAADEADGALPSAANIHILQDGSSATGTSDEGRAMAEIVHSIAPGAQIYFYTDGTNENSMATAIAALQAAGCQIIVDDVNFFDEPFYQTGDVIDNALDNAVAQGVTYFTAATNDANSFYEHAFVGFSDTLPIGQAGASKTVTAYNFGTATAPNALESITIPNGTDVAITLEWSQPFASIGDGAGATGSLGFYLFRKSGSTYTTVSSSVENVIGGDPVQFGTFTNNSSTTTYFLAVVLIAGSAPGLFKIVAADDSSGPVVFNDPNAGIGSGTVAGHELDPNAITVGAVPETNPATIESFSSTGPGLLLFDANGNPLPAPVSANKVNVTAPDGNSTSVPDINPFDGTSAAAPAAAAVGALLLQANPHLDPTDIASLLADSATAMAAGAAASGAGLVNADAAVLLAQSLVFDEDTTHTTLNGTHLNDDFVGGAGNHIIAGDGGTDTLDYSDAPGAVSVNLVTGIAQNGFGGSDTISGIQVVKGSTHGGTLVGGNGNDTFIIEGGANTIAGGSTGFAVTEIPVPTVLGEPDEITVGSDGAMWFTEVNGNRIGRITTAGAITEYALPTAGSQPGGIVAGPDNALWFTEGGSDKIGRITTAGAVTEFAIPTANAEPTYLTVGPDGALWFTENGSDKIGRITTAGAITEFAVPTADGEPFALTAGADGALWFTQPGGDRIGRITTAGVVTEFLVPTADAEPFGITLGPDGAVWFTEYDGNKIGRITSTGVITEFALPTFDANPNDVIAGPGGALWFAESGAGQIGRMTTTGAVTEYAVPSPSAYVSDVVAGPDGAIWFTEATADQIGQLTLSAAATLDYAAAPAAVTVNLATGTAANGFGATDSFTDVQDFIGSAFNDIFTAGPGTHVITGGGGDDMMIFHGARGAYTITQVTSNEVTVADSDAARDGTQTLINFGVLQFADQTVVTGGGVVAQLYQDILLRAPNASELAAGTAAAVLAASTEAQVDVLPIVRLYQTFFDRAPDAVGLNTWVNAFRDGESLSAIAIGFASSAEFQALYGTLPAPGVLVTDLYGIVLGRLPDPAGYAGWIATLTTAGNTAAAEASLVLSFANSAEFVTDSTSPIETWLTNAGASGSYATGIVQGLQGNIGPTPPSGTTLGFVEQLYQTVLLRPGTSGDIDVWASQLSAGTVTQGGLDASFVAGPEVQTYVLPVARLYQTFFERAPDASGLDSWVNALRHGTSLDSIAAGFAQSAEFQAHYGVNPAPAVFVAALYQDVLGRGPDAAGAQYWANILTQAGNTPAAEASVALSFANSAEFVTDSTTPIENWLSAAGLSGSYATGVIAGLPGSPSDPITTSQADPIVLSSAAPTPQAVTANALSLDPATVAQLTNGASGAMTAQLVTAGGIDTTTGANIFAVTPAAAIDLGNAASVATAIGAVKTIATDHFIVILDNGATAASSTEFAVYAVTAQENHALIGGNPADAIKLLGLFETPGGFMAADYHAPAVG